MVLLLQPEDWLPRLIAAHDKLLPDLRLMDAYYEGTQPLSYMAPQLANELGDRMRQVIVGYPQLVVDALDERLDVEGFRYADSESTEDDLWEVWQASSLDEGSQQAHVDALALARSYIIVGRGDTADMPLVTAESALDVYAARDPRSGTIAAAIKRWEDPSADGTPVKMANVYLPDVRVTFEYADGKWAVVDKDEHKLGVVPVVPLANRPRIKYRDGRSEITSIRDLSDAACKLATDMMLAAEFHAIPRRWAVGLSQEDFTDSEGQPIGALSALAGRLWTSESSDVKFGQFNESDLSNFHGTIDALARLVSALTGLPPAFLGLATDQPPSADAIRASEARLVKRAERRQRAFGEAWERVMRLVLLVRDGSLDPRTRSLETIWRDPSTPTYAQKADAVVKLHAAGLLPEEQAWEDLGYSAVQRARMASMRDDQITRLAAADLHALSTSAAYTSPPSDPTSGDTPPGTPPGATDAA